MKKICLYIATILFLSACDRQKDIDLKLPPYVSQMVVECYLQPGKPFRLSILESVSYFDLPYPPTVDNAFVTITHNGVVDTLDFVPTIDTAENKFYNYVSTKSVPFDYYTDFVLYVKDTKGRVATASTVILPPVPIDTVKFRYSDKDSMAATVTTFHDDPAKTNYYRYTVVYPLTQPIKNLTDYQADDRNLNSSTAELLSGYNIDRKTQVKISLYHITKEFYDFYSSVTDAKNANGNPFSQPSNIKSNVNGAIGIFTGLSGSSVTKTTQ